MSDDRLRDNSRRVTHLVDKVLRQIGVSFPYQRVEVFFKLVDEGDFTQNLSRTCAQSVNIGLQSAPTT